MTEETKLPAGFQALEPLVSHWALVTQNERQARRIGSTRAELRSFYDAMLPQLEAVLVHVDTFNLGELPLPSKRLYDMSLSLAEVAPHVELYGGVPNVPYSFDESRFVAEHGAKR